MKLKNYINMGITISAIIGVIIFIGAVGTSDYMDELGLYYPLIKVVKTFLVGVLMGVPALIREVINWLEI